MKNMTDKKRPRDNSGPRPICLAFGHYKLGGTDLGLRVLGPRASFCRRNLACSSLGLCVFGHHNLGLPAIGSRAPLLPRRRNVGGEAALLAHRRHGRAWEMSLQCLRTLPWSRRTLG